MTRSAEFDPTDALKLAGRPGFQQYLGGYFCDRPADTIEGWEGFVADVGRESAVRTYWAWVATQPEPRPGTDPDGETGPYPWEALRLDQSDGWRLYRNPSKLGQFGTEAMVLLDAVGRHPDVLNWIRTQVNDFLARAWKKEE